VGDEKRRGVWGVLGRVVGFYFHDCTWEDERR
jgi:hypothetical protein